MQFWPMANIQSTAILIETNDCLSLCIHAYFCNKMTGKATYLYPQYLMSKVIFFRHMLKLIFTMFSRRKYTEKRKKVQIVQLIAFQHIVLTIKALHERVIIDLFSALKV